MKKIITIIVLSLFVGGIVYASTINATPTITTFTTSTINTANTKFMQEGLKAWYPFDGIDTTINTSSDRSGNGLHATRSGGVSTTVGILGQGMVFDGVNDDDVLVNPTPTLNTSTISLWFNSATNVLPGNHRVMISGSANASGATYLSITTNGVGQPFVSYRIGATQRTLNSLTTISTNRWYHMVVTWDGTFIKIYIDGELKATSANLAGTGALVGFDGNSSYIGRYQLATGFQWQGSLDDVRFYDYAMATSEIQALYNLPRNTKINTNIPGFLTDGLVLHQTFNGSDFLASTSTDRVSTTNNGVIVGTTTIKDAGVIGQAVRFVGVSNNYINLSGAGNNLLLRKKTISFWVKVDSTNVDGIQPILSNQTANYYFGLGSGRKLLLSQTFNTSSPGQVAYSSAGTYPIGRYFLASVTVDDATALTTTIRFYIDGVLDSTQTNTQGLVSPTGVNFIFGAFVPGSFNFNGWVDDLRVYNRALSTQEIYSLYKLGR